MKIAKVRNSLKLYSTSTLVLSGALLFSPWGASAQTASSGDRWLHVRVVSSDSKGETVCVNVPLEMAEKILPIINKNPLHGGKVTVDKLDAEGVDLRALLEVVRTAKDGEFVTVNGNDGEKVRVAKQGGFLLVHVQDGTSGPATHRHHGDKDSADKAASDKKQDSSSETAAHPSRVEVKIPLSVVDALLSGKKDELDLVAGLRMLSAQGDTELVSVKDGEDTVRVWVDSKNTNGSEGGTR